MNSILIKNGRIITAEKTFTGDILTRGGKIADIGSNLKATDAQTRSIDAAGLLVLPGGIDPHVHFELPVGNSSVSSDNFYTGTAAALAGGTTTIIDFVTPNPGQLLPDALDERRKLAAKSVCDYSLHMSVTEWRESIGDELKACAEKGVTSVKIYMAYKETIGLEDEAILAVMQQAARLDMLVLAHCENGDAVKRNQKELLAVGKTAPKYHAISRPPYVEGEAIQRAIRMTEKTGCSLYIVHISTQEGVAAMHAAKQRDLPVYGETCPHYLLLQEREYDRPPEDAVTFVMSPPLRPKSHPLHLWDALAAGTIDTLATDHCPFTLKQKRAGLNNFTHIPNGIAGVEHRMQLLFEHGVNSEKLSVEQFVNLTSTRPAKIFDLYPRKGVLAPGSDADIVLWDANTEDTISAKTHVQNCDHTIYEGWKVRGRPQTVICGGRIQFDDGKVFTKRGDGCFLSHT
jgi:dihydropyrimidinase